MLRLAQKSAVLRTSAKLLASSAASQHERGMSTKKAVVFNMGGSLVPAMSPVLQKYARDHSMTESELTTRLFKDGDTGLMEQIEPALLSRHGSEKANLAHVMSAIQSIRGEGLKTGLISEAGGLNSERIPVDKSLFDVVSSSLKGDVFDKLKVDSSDVVYLDNLEANLKAAQALGMTAIKVEDVEAALTELESTLKVPLKEFVPGFSWIFWDNANNPHKSVKENLLYYFLVIYLFMVAGHFTLRRVLKIDGTFQH
ncbi:uncharacterized protein LOC130653758 [Hydractinia symbiolongicarpus]|uniref:uncharacterized protein LOC130653758 n=1 Tax=Hydractinia symbiolongicarpus TaxID=13093 RepID=UPI00254AC5A7|nr:uncharacterized protein LOC130653758 [Hydractinia symbiolongicarpus]